MAGSSSVDLGSQCIELASDVLQLIKDSSSTGLGSALGEA